MQIKQTDFQKEYLSIKKDIDGAVARVLESGWYILGKEVESFEKELARFTNIRYCIGVASGTDAITIAVKALGLTSEDEVILPANVYPTVFGVALAGVKIKLCDVDSKTLNASLDCLKKAVTKNTKAVVVVHLYGNPVDIAPIKAFCKKKKLFLIEDCAQAIGATYKNKKVGTYGDIACFSFYPTKNLGAYGDGGAIGTNNKRLYERAKLLRMYGEKERYQSVMLGQNSRLDELQAAILAVKLKYLNKWTKKRRDLARIYRKNLKDAPIEMVEETKLADCVYHLFVIKSEPHDGLANYLKEKGIGVGVHYPIAIHMTKSFEYLNYKKGSFPVAEEACRTVLSLPMHAFLSKADVEYVTTTIKSYFRKKK